MPVYLYFSGSLFFYCLFILKKIAPFFLMIFAEFHGIFIDLLIRVVADVAIWVCVCLPVSVALIAFAWTPSLQERTTEVAEGENAECPTVRICVVSSSCVFSRRFLPPILKIY